MECHLLWHFIISELHSLVFHHHFHHHFHVHYCRMYGYVILKSLRQHHCSNMLHTYVATKCTTNEFLFDTYVNNKLLNGMPSVVAFYYQPATVTYSLLFHYYFHVHSCMNMSCWKALGNITAQTCCLLMWPQKLNKLDDRKKIQF